MDLGPSEMLKLCALALKTFNWYWCQTLENGCQNDWISGKKIYDNKSKDNSQKAVARWDSWWADWEWKPVQAKQTKGFILIINLKDDFKIEKENVFLKVKILLLTLWFKYNPIEL